MELRETGEQFLANQAIGLLDSMMEYKEMMMAYSCAIKEVRTRYPPTVSNIEMCLNDIAGVRVICSYVDDIYRIRSRLYRG